MWILKTVFSRFLFPAPLSLEFLTVGLILLWFTRRQRAGKGLVTTGAMLLLVFSNNSFSNALLRPLEHHYPPLVTEHMAPTASSRTYIAVLGGSTNDDPTVSATSHVSPDMMARLTEGVILQRELPGSRLILSGGSESPEGLVNLARALGVKAEDILGISGPRDTEEESLQIAPIVGRERLVLVTSAAHMPRAMGFFRKRGLQPVAAPTDYLAPRQRGELRNLIPDASCLFKSQVAVYEYLGLAWEKLRGKI
jgi:uncharacterized SAM-binding protein YcdF (DUF218 family)